MTLGHFPRVQMAVPDSADVFGPVFAYLYIWYLYLQGTICVGGKVDTVVLTRGASAAEKMSSLSWALLALEFVFVFAPVHVLFVFV